MKLHEHKQAHMNLVSRYGEGEIQINGRRLTAPIMVAPGFLQPLPAADPTALTLACLEPLWALEPGILLLGTAHPPAEVIRTLRTALARRQVALEAMQLGAACRTYNVLAQEDRSVAALLFP